VNGAKLFLFECGTLRGASQEVATGVVGARIAAAMRSAGEGYAWPVPWYLVTHPRGNVVIDGGSSPRCAIDPEGHLGESTVDVMPRMDPEQACVPTLERQGIDPESVRYIVQSHLHWDHTGALASSSAFPNAKVVVTRDEYEFALSPDWPYASAYAVTDFSSPDIDWDLLEDEDGFDLLGDGTLRIWRSPGHSVGHVSFELNLDDSGAFLLLADLANTQDHWERAEMSGFHTSGLSLVRSLGKMRRIATARRATVICGHDPENWPGYRHSPEFYG
jgi:glyoxylase-like metal-dependent hydrolase (beta-lactamase superfamily II)